MESVQLSNSATRRLNQDEFLVVGMGASAGGVEALESFFSLMPKNTDVAIVVVQHLSPKFESLMPQIISRRTGIPVSSATDGDIIKPNHIYVLPAGKEIILSGNAIRLKDRPEKSASTSTIDQFFRSLGQEFKHRAVAIVLSGTGSDGSAGVMDVHEEGGYVIVQSETSAKFNGMPRAAAESGIADAVISVDEIPAALVRLDAVLRSDNPDEVVVEDFRDDVGQVLQLLRKQFAIDFSQYKGSMIKRRVERRLMLSDPNNVDIGDYLARLEQDPDELNQLFSDLLIGVTEFFRDPDAFEVLRNETLPELLQAKKNSDVFRVWVVPTATGEEAYSLAMLIDEVMEELDLKLEVKIFATDAHDSSIEFASRGIYSAASLANVTKERTEKYFRESDGAYHVCRHLRKMVVFAQHNVLSDAPFASLDLVSCRNLLIYLKPATQRKALSLFNFALNESGTLMLGPSENVSDFADSFETRNEKWRLYRKVSSIRPSKMHAALGDIGTVKAQPTQPARNSGSLTETYDQLIDQFIPPSLLISENSEILHVFSGASKFLTIREGRPTRDVMQMLPDSLRVAVANGIKRCRDGGEQVVYAGLECEINGKTSAYRVTIRPIKNRRTRSMDLLVSFADSTLAVEPVEQTELDNDGVNVERVRSLESELRDTRQSLHASIQELKSANEEMQSTNEELIASNEELQSTNEELHSVNEELYTVNSEHQRKITELTELTDDMENLLDSIRVDTIFLDRNLELRKFTLGIAKTFRLIPQDVGRKIDSFNHDLQHDGLVADIQAVLDSEQAIEKDVQNKTGSWYLMRLLPYTSRGRVDGVLLTLIDITQIKATEQKLAELSEIVEVSDDAIFRVDNNGTIGTWNRGAQALYGYEPDEVIGENLGKLVSEQTDRDALRSAVLSASQNIPLASGDRAPLNANADSARHVQMKHVRSSGNAFDVEITISPIVSLSGQSNGASIVIRDISAQTRAQEEVQNAVRKRDEFLAMLSHELRNPLAAILNADSLLREKDIDSDVADEARDVAETQLRHLTRLLDDLLDVARITNDKLTLHCEALDLRKSMMEAVECVQHQLDEKSQRLFVEATETPVFVFGDVGRLQQAQVNLLVNASKYTPTGGEIRYSLSIDGKQAVLKLVDDGIGVSKDLSDSIFDLFVQSEQALDRSQGGMGIGLPLVKMIAEAHGGSVSLESGNTDRGSVFSLRLPLTNQTPVALQAPRENLLVGKRLLLIEDSEGIRRMLARSLQLKGLEVADADNAEDGLALLGSFDPEIAVIDIGLPDVNGYEVARRIRQTPDRNQVLLVAVTGYGRAEDREKAFEAGFDEHLVKPVDPSELVDKLGTLSERMRKAGRMG
jgi:two-component system CheB/CheR fusion protein